MSDKPLHLPFLDAFRGLAIFAVFLFHALGIAFGIDHLPWNGLVRDFKAVPYFLAFYPLTYGSAGVAAFFVISGFCIHLSHARNPEPGWLKFFCRRFFRIYPPYLLALLIFFFVWPWGDFSIKSQWRLEQFVSHVLAIHNFNERTCFGINGSFWSIAVEIQLYALYPVLIWLVQRCGWRVALAIIGLIEVSINSIVAVHGVISSQELPYFMTFSPLAFWLSWTIGAYMAECYLTDRKSPIARMRFDVMALIAVASPLFRPTAPFAFLAFSLLTGVAIERFLSGAWPIPRGLVPGKLWLHFGRLGVLSYSFYLLHQPFLPIGASILGYLFPNSEYRLLIAMAGCLGCYFPILWLSNAFYNVVERPSISVGKFVLHKIQPARQAIEPSQQPFTTT
ncbi:MAG: acyltransferase, partial [Planctomycetaceae bacterium]|nr:acyltransferase [Planctomycetaceae bacterium]